MSVCNHRLVDEVHTIDFVTRSNIGGMIAPRCPVVYYAAGSSAAGGIGGVENPVCQVSAHRVMARDGRLMHRVPLRVFASTLQSATGRHQGREAVAQGRVVAGRPNRSGQQCHRHRRRVPQPGFGCHQRLASPCLTRCRIKHA